MRYDVIERNEKHVEAIAARAEEGQVAVSGDRPGPRGRGDRLAHLHEMLKERGELDGKTVHRVAFYEITKNAIKEAIAEPRGLSLDLVNAQQARRALDYLVGFNLSPLLWKKVQRGLSAGRVQSPALRMICEREDEIEGVHAAGILDARCRRRAHRAELPAEADRIRRPEGRAVQFHERRRRAQRRAHDPRCRCGRHRLRRVAAGHRRSTASSGAAIRRRRSPPPRCSRKPRASSGFRTAHDAPRAAAL